MERQEVALRTRKTAKDLKSDLKVKLIKQQQQPEQPQQSLADAADADAADAGPGVPAAALALADQDDAGVDVGAIVPVVPQARNTCLDEEKVAWCEVVGVHIAANDGGINAMAASTIDALTEDQAVKCAVALSIAEQKMEEAALGKKWSTLVANLVKSDVEGGGLVDQAVAAAIDRAIGAGGVVPLCHLISIKEGELELIARIAA